MAAGRISESRWPDAVGRGRVRAATRLSNADRAALDLITAQGYALVVQVSGWKALASRRLIRIEFGPAATLDADRLCCYITDLGKEALGGKR